MVTPIFKLGLRHALLVASVVLMACDPCAPSHDAFTIGMSRSEILSKFGEPQQMQTLTKVNEPIWGPVEDIWSQVETGATIEIWSYDSCRTSAGNGRLSERQGQTELYFVNDSDEVSGIGFYIKGAVYEAS